MREFSHRQLNADTEVRNSCCPLQASPAKTKAIEELKTFISTERDARQVKKALAVKLIYQDYGYEVITGILEVSLGALSKWKQADERDGLVGFRPQHKGRQSYLTSPEREAVLQWLQTKTIWELSELEFHLAETYDVVYESKQSYYDLFAATDLSWKKTSKVNPKADAQAVSAKKSKSSGYWHATKTRSQLDA
ncbi:winged helix-turn-helix domain-containing protein [Oscillatoria sp. CS-180]|uniref:helix-turn-helix domain-containing protein n=1 Tax=Oscillatoria sp. CS-180 TaxID=3021720 RepID=UPI00232D6C35|nr:winged helix-turn-helix domain-containing protein [Oscillatoria sp. CS-180]MDB9526291.1 winged helix-turn-helix domain-containing protein [Oscillatoria sp. CS-180]